ncbi:MerR family transcriptional regulator [Amycolatopsis sp. NPDC048633]|uniref:MerR family transcriptional regulator n=1 Tax=Amycolatopsis sp. NPDC048633 TaxID=3157095 RepID=UPI0033CEF2DA
MMIGVTIGQAAAFAGVTVKTVRHYHKLGLVAEPERDSSGYRRYGSAALSRLVGVRALAAAGVPLAEIGRLPDSGTASFAASLADVERHLTDRIDELTAQRDTLRRLARGDHALLPARAVALLEGMPGLGFSADDVTAAQESFVLAKVLVPEGFDDYLDNVESALKDPRFLALVQRSAEVGGWEPDDPRVAELAADLAGHYLAHPAQLKIVTGLQARTETATRYRLIAHHSEGPGTAAARLAALVEAKLRAAGVQLPRPGSP